ncbi:MAG: malonyl-ACP O-methyltransferase BioC [Pseudomonadota bacterium]|nr:malonyl-ACP O-methyltransferase BioC [Pseudomonadota bacterium]
MSESLETRLGASRTRKTDIARGFGNASATYESASRLQRFMGNTMLQKLQAMELDVSDGRVLDLGCGTGWFTRKLQSLQAPATLTGIDLSPGMILQASGSSPGVIDWLVADAEHLPVASGSQDLVFSNLMIQWCDDPRGVLRECRRVLRPGGWLVMSTLVDGTLRELKAAWQGADPGHQHVNRFETASDLQVKVDRQLPGVDLATRTIRLPYASPMALAAELRHLGAGFRGAGRRTAVTGPGRLRAMCGAYPKEADGTVMASYEAAWIYWQKHRECP